MGNGPEHLLACGLSERLSREGWEVIPSFLMPTDPFPTENGTGFSLQSLAAGAVAHASSRGEFPLILAGNCNTAAIGALAGMAGERKGIVWLDGHGDFNTPETTETGFLDGMALAMATGRCWTSMIRKIHGFEPVPEENVLLIGGQDLDPVEAETVARSPMTHLGVDELRQGGVANALASLRSRANAAYLHVDLDVHGRGHGRVNDYQPVEGLAPDEVREIIAQVTTAIPVSAAALTAYDPACDVDGRMAAIAIDLAAFLLAQVGSGASAPL
ncbi:MAG TPA: arginase family protein [Stellaceae bacterium]|nr:arginase family protein [Stellaceae bacterium]